MCEHQILRLANYFLCHILKDAKKYYFFNGKVLIIECLPNFRKCDFIAQEYSIMF